MHNNDSSSEVQPKRPRLQPRKPPTGGKSLCADDEDDADPHCKHPFPPIAKTELPADIVLADFAACRLTHHRNRPVMASRMPGPRRHESVLVADRDRGRHAAHALLGRLPGPSSAQGTRAQQRKHLFASMYALMFGHIKAHQCQQQLSPGNPRKGSVTRQRPNACIGRRSWKDSRRIVPSSSNSPYSSSYRLDAIQALGIGYDSQSRCWIFPEVTDAGLIVGLVRRYRDGQKRAMSGSMHRLNHSAL